jgi:hypothetical protein
MIPRIPQASPPWEQAAALLLPHDPPVGHGPASRMPSAASRLESRAIPSRFNFLLQHASGMWAVTCTSATLSRCTCDSGLPTWTTTLLPDTTPLPGQVAPLLPVVSQWRPSAWHRNRWPRRALRATIPGLCLVVLCNLRIGSRCLLLHRPGD